MRTFASAPASTLQHENLYKRNGLLPFLKNNKTIMFALFSGLICTVGTNLFTSWLSRQVLSCPDWSIRCDVSVTVKYIRNNLGIVQGLVTALYTIGLAATAHAAHALSECALWPLLAQRGMTFKQIEKYLEASRGSVPASPSALFAARSSHSLIILTCTVAITLLPLSSAPLVGYVYQRRNETVPFRSSYRPGGGIGPLYKQTSPPQSIRASAATLYASWSLELASEPLPDYRDWFLDRANLADRGNMSVVGTRILQNISCYSWRPPGPRASDQKDGFLFTTQMKYGDSRHDEEIKVLPRPKLTVWADNYKFMSANRTKTTLAFAALNGTITGGDILNELPDLSPELTQKIVNISTAACDVDLELVNDHLRIGHSENSTIPVQINSVDNIRRRENSSTSLNELALWFGVAPVTNCPTILGAQPMYKDDSNYRIPITFTSTALDGVNDRWNLSYIEHFIKVSIGASALGDSTNALNFDPVEFTSLKTSVKLDPSRPLLLWVPLLGIVICAIILLAWNILMHRRKHIPIMRLATLSEFTKSAQTEDLRRIATNDLQIPNRPSQLDDITVQFGITRGGLWGLLTTAAQYGLLAEQEPQNIALKCVSREQISDEGFQ